MDIDAECSFPRATGYPGRCIAVRGCNVRYSASCDRVCAAANTQHPHDIPSERPRLPERLSMSQTGTVMAKFCSVPVPRMAVDAAPDRNSWTGLTATR